jgi:inosine/xanthosine triphosphatase
MQTIIVASQNPVKIAAVKQGFRRMFPTVSYTVRGVTVSSGVPDQPLSDAETLQGALNRANNASSLDDNADFYVGIEGGVDTHDTTLQCFAWIAIRSNEQQRTGKARTATYYLPEETAKLVRGGMELGDADDLIFGRTNSKQHNGSVGLLTDDVVDRTAVYEQAVILALIPFKNKTLTFYTRK